MPPSAIGAPSPSFPASHRPAEPTTEMELRGREKAGKERKWGGVGRGRGGNIWPGEEARRKKRIMRESGKRLEGRKREGGGWPQQECRRRWVGGHGESGGREGEWVR